MTGAESFFPSGLLKLKWKPRRVGGVLVICCSIGRTGSIANDRADSLAIACPGFFVITGADSFVISCAGSFVIVRADFFVVTCTDSFVVSCTGLFVITCTMSFAVFWS